MLEFLIFFTLLIAVFVFFLRLATGYATDWVARDIVTRLRQGETIINRSQVPESWLAPYRKRLRALRSAGRDEAEAERLGEAARSHFLRQLDGLTAFFERTNLTDTQETRQTLLAALRQRRSEWASQPWQAFFEQTRQDDVQDIAQ